MSSKKLGISAPNVKKNSFKKVKFERAHSEKSGCNLKQKQKYKREKKEKEKKEGEVARCLYMLIVLKNKKGDSSPAIAYISTKTLQSH